MATPTPSSREGDGPSASKRRRLNRGTSSTRTASADPEEPEASRSPSTSRSPSPARVALQREKANVDNKKYYDPEQPMSERRAVRRGFRDLARDLADSRGEYLTPNSTGLHDTIIKANELFDSVKQTADATLDARLLVLAGDMTARRAMQTKTGGVGVGIDVDEFVRRCVSFMRKGPVDDADAEIAPAASQPARPRNGRRGGQAGSETESEGEEVDEGDALDWAWLGVKASFPYNIRPPVPGFMLGPLSAQKKRRQMTQRTARQQKRDIADAARPDEIRLKEVERLENSNLKQLCTDIYTLLVRTEQEGTAACDEEFNTMDEPPEEGSKAFFDLMRRYKIRSTGGVCLFEFAYNPRSFGQTVENLFYISFLIRDGLTGVKLDSHALPTLCEYPWIIEAPVSLWLSSGSKANECNPGSESAWQRPQIKDKKDKDGMKYQAVFNVDFDSWHEIVKDFDIKESIIPHRQESTHGLGSKTWYG